jgi:hypothetical protein
MAIHRGNHWTPEEDQRLLELIGSGKSWVLISILLKPAIHQRPNPVLEAKASQNQATRLGGIRALPRDKVKAPWKLGALRGLHSIFVMLRSLVCCGGAS